MTPWETDLMVAATELGRIRRLHAQTFLINTARFKTIGEARAAADEDHIEALTEAEARYEIAKSRLIRGGTDADTQRDASEAISHDPSSIEC